MPTYDSGESRRIPIRSHGGGGQVTSPADQQQNNQEQLPCPRCDSTNTKFCYYNNYNFSQPRHFCKSCRRYWTHGGTLRDIPIGGGSRKGAKRSRTCSNGTLTAPLQATPVLFPSSTMSTTVTTPPVDNESKGNALSLCGSFTSLLNANANANATQGLGGFGIGLGSGFDDVSFGLGRAMWPFSSVADHATSGVGSNGGHAPQIPATWQFEGLESSNSGGFVSSEYFAWPELSITTPGNTLK